MISTLLWAFRLHRLSSLRHRKSLTSARRSTRGYEMTWTSSWNCWMKIGWERYILWLKNEKTKAEDTLLLLVPEEIISPFFVMGSCVCTNWTWDFAGLINEKLPACYSRAAIPAWPQRICRHIGHGGSAGPLAITDLHSVGTTRMFTSDSSMYSRDVMQQVTFAVNVFTVTCGNGR